MTSVSHKNLQDAGKRCIEVLYGVQLNYVTGLSFFEDVHCGKLPNVSLH